MNPTVKEFVYYGAWVYGFGILLFLAFFIPNIELIFKKKISQLDAGRWIAIFFVSIFWLPVIFVLTLINRYKNGRL